MIPLGTVIIQETKSPSAYLLPDPSPVYVLKITMDATGKVVETLTKDGVPQSSITNLNALIAPEEGRGVLLYKKDVDTGEPLEGALFAIYKETSPGSGVFETDPLATLRSDKDGLISFTPLDSGTYKIVELEPPDGYLLPEDTQDMVTLIDADSVITLHKANKKREVIAEKYDVDTNEPVADTEYTLYTKVGNDTSQETMIDPVTGNLIDDQGTWQNAGVAVTNDQGKAVLTGIVNGSYRLEETRSNPLYTSAKESGEGPRYFEINSYSTDEVQVFYDKKIQISCEVYKDTINITSAAFKTFDDDYIQVNNIGKEEYRYYVGFRSTSNVRADEFVVDDPLENVASGQVIVTGLWTPECFGDTDGTFNLWYQTNYTDPSTVYSNADAMTDNPSNPNNPNNDKVWPNTGWKLWGEGLSTTATTYMSVDALGLASGEHITAIRYEYGSVEVGFTTGTKQAFLQEGKSVDWSVVSGSISVSGQDEVLVLQAADDIGTLGSDSLYSAVYTVLCPHEILPPETIASSVQAHIARNYVLTDQDYDAVQTTVIAPFEIQTAPDRPFANNSGSNSPNGGSPQTGDSLSLLVWAAVLTALLGFALVFAGQIKRQSEKRWASDKGNKR